MPMDEARFRRFLKQRGKEERVVDGLVRQVLRLDAFLVAERGAELETASAPDVQAYAAACEAEAGSSRVLMRGPALYYQFCGNAVLAGLASAIREQCIAAARKPFRLKDMRGVDPDDLARLRSLGIADADQMLTAGRTPADREALARQTGVAPQAILEYVKLSDLSRVGGLKTVRARLYHDGGFDTLDKIATADPEEMRAALAAYVERTGFDGIPPLPKEARHTVAAAQTLPRLVEV